jgi:hypothetical protein
MPEPEPLPEPKPEPAQPGKDPFKTDWPTYERPHPKPAKPGRALDFFDEDFDNIRYTWDWLPAGVTHVKGTAGTPGSLQVSGDKSFQTLSNVPAAEVRLSLWRDMSEADMRKQGKDAKGYEVQFRWRDAMNYSALQIRGDGFYRIIEFTNGQAKTLVGDSEGGYLPLPRWNRESLYDTVVVTFKDASVSASFNGNKLLSTNSATQSVGKVGVKSLNGLKLDIEKMSVDEVAG